MNHDERRWRRFAEKRRMQREQKERRDELRRLLDDAAAMVKGGPLGRWS